MSKDPKVYGMSTKDWEAAFRPGIIEFSALRFANFREHGVVRIAFGNNGPPTNETGARGTPVFTHAVTLTEEVALSLANSLTELIASAKK